MGARTRKPTHPGANILHDYLGPLGLTVAALAAHLGLCRNRLSRMIHELSSLAKLGEGRDA